MEVWKDIPGYEGRYQASTEGRIRSMGGLKLCRYGRTGTTYTMSYQGRIKKMSIGSHGYPVVNLGHADIRTVHSLVMLTFVGKCPKGMEICHNDGNRLNTRLSNLRYDTHKANEADKILHGTRGGWKWRKDCQ